MNARTGRTVASPRGLTPRVLALALGTACLLTPAAASAAGEERTPAPAGFLDFCARHPAECSLKVEGAYDAEAARRALYSRYLWSVAFRRVAPAALSSDPSVPQVVITPRAAAAAPTPAAPGATDTVVIEEVRHAPTRVPFEVFSAQLGLVNRLVNAQIRQASDDATHGVIDYWTLPLQEAGGRRGDCEDYVLEKRRALLARGVPAGAMTIAIGKTRRGEDHAVLLVATDRGEMVLDSLSSHIVERRQAPYRWVQRQAPGRQMAWVSMKR